MESNEQNERTSKTVTNSETESRLTALGWEGGWGEGSMSKKEKGLKGMDNSVVTAGREMGIRGINDNGKTYNKNKFKLKNTFSYVTFLILPCISVNG